MKVKIWVKPRLTVLVKGNDMAVLAGCKQSPYCYGFGYSYGCTIKLGPTLCTCPYGYCEPTEIPPGYPADSFWGNNCVRGPCSGYNFAFHELMRPSYNYTVS
jgi:hypothetical protein